MQGAGIKKAATDYADYTDFRDRSFPERQRTAKSVAVL